jgi:hypothetical protein
MSRSPRLVLLAPVLVLLVAASACAERASRQPALAHHGNGASEVAAPGDVLAQLRAAGDAALGAGSARFEVTLALEVEPPEGDTVDGPIVVELVTSGAFSGRRLELSTDLGSMIRSVDPDAPLPSGFDEPMRTVLDGTTAYLRLPAIAELLGTDGWVVATPDELVALEERPEVAPGPGVGGVDPIAILDVLSGLREVRLIGEEEVDGVRAAHVRGEADVAAVLGSEDQPETLVVPVDAWIDHAGLVRRLEADLSEAPEHLGALGRLASAPKGGGVAGSATMTLTLSDYGADIEVPLPAADEVVPLRQALASVDHALRRSGRAG